MWFPVVGGFDLTYFATLVGSAIGFTVAWFLAKRGNLRDGSSLLLVVAVLSLAIGVTYDPHTSVHHLLLLGFVVPVMIAFFLDRWWVGAGLVGAAIVFLAAHAAHFAHPAGEVATLALVFATAGSISASDAVLRGRGHRRAQVAETESGRLRDLNEMQIEQVSAADKRTGEAESREHQATSDFKGIVERVPDGVLETTLGGDVLYLNPAGIAMFGRLT